MAAIDPAFAKGQLMLLAAPRSQHPYGTVPAFEWDIAVTPPVIAWAVWQIYQRLEGTPTGEGRRAVFGGNELFQNDRQWRNYVPFHEHFHGHTGEGLGAGHQTGWTALVALPLPYGGRLCIERGRADGALASGIPEGKVA